MKIAIIVPYFGKLPNYIQLFLDSCTINNDYTWFIFTDDDYHYNYPNNVKKIKMTFFECVELFSSKFDFNINLYSPQKLCDFKCAYGYIFSDYLKEYDWWGHCDLDQIFGNLNNFITDEMLIKYDKLFSLGHLTLYRNTADNNFVFMNTLNGKIRYKDVFTSEFGCAFDEWLPDNINEIYLQTNRMIMLDNIGADINPYRTDFSLVYFDLNSRTYVHDKYRNSIFQWDNGSLYRIYKNGKTISKIEFPYVHLQKRKMNLSKLKDSSKYYIIPNKFINSEKSESSILNKTKKLCFFNYQFFLVKYKSLKLRIKNNNWNFSNVFKDNP